MKTTLITLILLTLMATGCAGSAQLARKDSTGGTVALEGPYMPAMGEARMLMVEHCGGRFTATEQGERVSFRCRSASEAGHGARVARLDSHGGGL